MIEFKLSTPVAFIIFNRPDTTQRVFDVIRKIRPPILLVIADGPRSSRPGENEKCALTRAIIDKVDWNCKILKNYSKKNLGCKNRIASGIDWVFEQVEEAIILEDDCLPDPSFFRFCEELLEKYRKDKRIGMISGDNFQFSHNVGVESYYFSKYFHIWGWATWRDRWQESYDVNMKLWPILLDRKKLVDLVGNDYEVKYWKSIFNKVYENKIDTWDYQWLFANWVNARFSIVPRSNLISNIGFMRSDATHTVGNSIEANLALCPLNFPLNHPPYVIRNILADDYEYKILIDQTVFRRFYNKAKSLLNI